jgi:hypothetical protein
MSTGRCAADWQRRTEACKDCTVSEDVEGFTRRLQLTPGYDHTAFADDCGRGGHGLHGMELRCVLIGPQGATQWLVYLSQLIPGTEVKFGSVKPRWADGDVLMAADIGYHWTVPRYEGQERRECDLLPEGFCYYDGSSLRAEELVAPFLVEGLGAVWKRLRDEYDELAMDTGAVGGFGQVLRNLVSEVS